MGTILAAMKKNIYNITHSSCSPSADSNWTIRTADFDFLNLHTAISENQKQQTHANGSNTKIIIPVGITQQPLIATHHLLQRTLRQPM